MKTKLQEAKKVFETEKFKKKAMPEVLEYLKRAKERVNNNTVYNSELTDEIMKAENLPQELEQYLNTEVYLAQRDYRTMQEAEYTAKMIADGWKPLTEETEYRGKCQYIAKKSMDWMIMSLENTGTLIDSKTAYDREKHEYKTELFLIPKGKRSRGYYVRNLENAFYKPLTK